MCGIAGLYRTGARPLTADDRAADRALVERMLRSIEYRGPDDQGLESVGRATLGVRRLAILDVQGGHQPIADASGRVWAIQNGELYNYPELHRELASRHAFRTRTDTELYPYLYLERSADYMKPLRGMFASAVYDLADDTMVLARDPVGVKPLYIAQAGERLLFASEIKPLLCDSGLDRTLDLEAIGRYLALGWMPGESTPFRSVRKVRPGCRVVVTPGERRTERYWNWPRFFTAANGKEPPLETIVDEAETRIRDAAVSMLLSDRPLGVLLSGGIDSSLLVALLPEEVRRQTRTFAIGFEGAGYHDERSYARIVAERFGTKHREFAAPLDVAAELPRLITFLDEPLADPAALPAHLVARSAAEDVTVLLSGTGGDEVFGGYRRYRMGELLRKVSFIPRGLAGAGADWIAEGDLHRSSRAGERLIMLRKLLQARSKASEVESYVTAFETAPAARWDEALAVDARTVGVGASLLGELIAETGTRPRSLEELAFTFDHLYYLPDDLLLKEDRTTMGTSVEGRVPYLDHPLVEFAAAQSLQSRLGGGQGKQVLRVLARRHLPPEISERPKHGFSVPFEEWLRGPLAPLVRETFAGSGSGVFRMDVLRRWHQEHLARRDRAWPLWTALCFELWWSRIGSASPDAIVDSGRPLAARR